MEYLFCLRSTQEPHAEMKGKLYFLLLSRPFFFLPCVCVNKNLNRFFHVRRSPPICGADRQITDHQRIHTRARDSRNEPISDQRHITSEI